MKYLILAGALGLAPCIAPAIALAQENGPVDENLVLGSEAFLSSHPDLNNRHRGMRAYEDGQHGFAMMYFKRAARYADKPSQAMVAEMLWKGEGVDRDPALAYAWMDLAAERGYPGFTIIRERYWEQLDERQRQDAVARGEEIYAEYGDTVAQPRIATVLRRERRRTTGSRTGFVGALTIQIPGPGGQMQTISGDRFYDRKFWEPELYQAWHDAVWTQPRQGRVDIGEIDPIRPGESPPEED
ncbi:MAG: sel1 repeat family protein [Gammaproteobacteria bacterium]|nr:sel1 repeat family protein [Gammaproteobacteria bacterium]